uniref:NR LBD domain-containing protein n=1 Tax=Mesocestoides corti TaxID=53468 RepID=A0A5K3G2N1_MESCO
MNGKKDPGGFSNNSTSPAQPAPAHNTNPCPPTSRFSHEQFLGNATSNFFGLNCWPMRNGDQPTGNSQLVVSTSYQPSHDANSGVFASSSQGRDDQPQGGAKGGVGSKNAEPIPFVPNPILCHLPGFAIQMLGFSSLNSLDQMQLLQTAITDILTLPAAHTLSLILRRKCGGKVMGNEDWLTVPAVENTVYPEIGTSSDICSFFTHSLAFKLHKLQVDDVEVAMLAAFLLINPYRPDLSDVSIILTRRNTLTEILRVYANRRRSTHKFAAPLDKFPEMIHELILQVALITLNVTERLKQPHHENVIKMSLYLNELIEAIDDAESNNSDDSVSDIVGV